MCHLASGRVLTALLPNAVSRGDSSSKVAEASHYTDTDKPVLELPINEE